jgi:hypothetical protein
MISVHGLRKTYGTKLVLDRIDARAPGCRR